MGRMRVRRVAFTTFQQMLYVFLSLVTLKKLGSTALKQKHSPTRIKNKDKERRQYQVGIFNNFLKAVKLVKKWLQEA